MEGLYPPYITANTTPACWTLKNYNWELQKSSACFCLYAHINKISTLDNVFKNNKSCFSFLQAIFSCFNIFFTPEYILWTKRLFLLYGTIEFSKCCNIWGIFWLYFKRKVNVRKLCDCLLKVPTVIVSSIFVILCPNM